MSLLVAVALLLAGLGSEADPHADYKVVIVDGDRPLIVLADQDVL